ncbi:hypothetical protein ACUXV3_20370 (plasmid) [Roseobacteraceae bacterium NS-SX3]
MFRRLRSDQFLPGMRRLSWYLRRGWPGIDISRDPVPVFYQDMRLPELAAQRSFLLRRAARLPRHVLLCEMSCISACEALGTFGTPGYPSAWHRFHRDASAALQAALETPQPAPSAPPETPIQQEFSRTAAEQALRDTLQLLERNGIEAFILSGTFLGAIREKAILDHDYDIDLGVMADTTDKDQLETVLQNSPPFRCISTASQVRLERDAAGQLVRRVVPVLYKLRHQNGIIADIFLHYEEDGVLWHGSSLYRWDNAVFGLAPVTLAGEYVQGPDNADRYLTENYGNWRIPKRDFHCGSDTPNLQLLPNPLSLALALWQLSLTGGSSPSRARAELLQRMQKAGHIEPDGSGEWRIPSDLFAPKGQPKGMSKKA